MTDDKPLVCRRAVLLTLVDYFGSFTNLVVGETGFAEVVAALHPAHEALTREVNPVVFHALEFQRKLAEGSAFLKHVAAGKKIFILGGDDDLGKPAARRKAQGAARRRGRNRPAA